MEEKRMITGVLVTKEKAKVVTIPDELESYYKLLGCHTIEFAARAVFTGNIDEDKDKTLFNIVCDEEGLLQSDPIISAVNINGEAELVGNLFVTGPTNEDGEISSLNEEEQNRVLRACRRIPTKFHPEGLKMLVLRPLVEEEEAETEEESAG